MFTLINDCTLKMQDRACLVDLNTAANSCSVSRSTTSSFELVQRFSQHCSALHIKSMSEFWKVAGELVAAAHLAKCCECLLIKSANPVSWSKALFDGG